ncbi:hypothetical protein GCM10008098_19770 [Rhodanobacter panaciterrae]|uniref:Uncharacterized protein n=2 Tax=Rhodanobacter panaciterrae TaxID=490572 RepID=A0ABQ2ZWD3_9GAMM|nr:hypothetical protein GCM10008098_19770 [Rhodanobacter panaciterrae]
MPGGDSVGQPGWDGVLTVAEENAWVPAGASRWEMGCNENIARKASDDYKKRTDEYGVSVADTNFVFVSPRRWSKKKHWSDTVGNPGPWRSVRVLDADDLEVWLENAPATTLWFGELLGLAGQGIQSIGSYWETWRSQSLIPLSIEAISVGRETKIQALQDAISKLPPILVIEADSTEEAVAFACAELVSLGQSACAACVTAADGWRYVDTNPQLRILVAANSEVATARAPTEGQMLIVPVNIGDRPKHFSPLTKYTEVQRISLERPDTRSFEKALIAIGENEADSARYARSTGRSWSVYRRHMAANPAIAHPAWVKNPMARVLTAVVLVGGWNESRPGDIACLEEITGKKYEELERELLYLARLDDSPVLKIGHIWKAKAPLELLHIYAKEISGGELARYFATAEAVLATPDPALELDADKRWMASVYGKVRKESGIVIESIVDSLAKLNVYAESNRDGRMTSGVNVLVGHLLDGADGERWLSLFGVLRGLAEAAPDIFLSAVEASLRHKDAPISRLFTENNGDAAFGRNWHTDLLWALEILAWSPRHLGRVAEILAQLDAWPVQHNLMNRPMNTLISLFRPWWPQTTASIEIRLACLDHLLVRHSEVGWNLLVSLLPKHLLSASANAKPHWRDDDAGAPTPSRDISVHECYEQVAHRAVGQAQGQASRIATLVENLDVFGTKHRRKIIDLVEDARKLLDEDREIVRSAVRKYIGQHNTYNQDGQRRERTSIKRLRRQFDALAPASTSSRNAWLFENGRVVLPGGRSKNFEEENSAREKARLKAIEDVFNDENWPGLTRLSQLAVDPLLVGWSVVRAGLSKKEVTTWILDRFSESGSEWHDPLVSGVLNGLDKENRLDLMKRAVISLPPPEAAAFLSSAPCNPETWNFLEHCVDTTQLFYWKNVRPQIFLPDGDDLKFVIEKFIQAGRHRTAFAATYVGSDRGDPDQLLALLEGIAIGEEPDGPLPDSWHIGKAIERISDANITSMRQLARLEFAYFRALEHSNSTPHLYAELLSDPALIMECIALVYKSHNAPDAPIDESLRANAEIAWSVLHNGRGIPGLKNDGSIDQTRFDAWITEVRRHAVEIDRQIVTDLTIGEWLSASPPDTDGTWPCLAVRQLLERQDATDIHRGFHTGVMNNRGVHSRALDAGGTQERDLANHYRRHASAILISHPTTASVLEKIAKNYDHQAIGEDDDAKLMREGLS